MGRGEARLAGRKQIRAIGLRLDRPAGYRSSFRRKRKRNLAPAQKRLGGGGTLADTPRSPMSQPPESNGKKTAQGALALGALGVVFGDIGTSPLYTLRECLAALPPGEHAHAVLGVLSLVFWSLILIVSVKYTIFVLRADNRGEGGIFALLALSQLDRPGKTGVNVGVIIVLTGAAMLCGEAIITPAVTVLSAV